MIKICCCILCFTVTFFWWTFFALSSVPDLLSNASGWNQKQQTNRTDRRFCYQTPDPDNYHCLRLREVQLWLQHWHRVPNVNRTASFVLLKKDIVNLSRDCCAPCIYLTAPGSGGVLDSVPLSLGALVKQGTFWTFFNFFNEDYGWNIHYVFSPQLLHRPSGAVDGRGVSGVWTLFNCYSFVPLCVQRQPQQCLSVGRISVVISSPVMSYWNSRVISITLYKWPVIIVLLFWVLWALQTLDATVLNWRGFILKIEHSFNDGAVLPVRYRYLVQKRSGTSALRHFIFKVNFSFFDLLFLLFVMPSEHELAQGSHDPPPLPGSVILPYGRRG